MAEIEINDFFLSFGQYDVLCTSLNGWRCQHLAIGALHIWLSAMVILRILAISREDDAYYGNTGCGVFKRGVQYYIFA